MKGENSVERAERMIKDLDSEIEFLRGCAIDAGEHAKEADKVYRKAMEDLENIEDQIMDAIYNKMALKMFIDNGGGLDMYVD